MSPHARTEFPEYRGDPANPGTLANALAELSRYRVSRAYRDVKTVTAAYTIQPEDDRIILVDTTAGNITITLPDADNADITEYVVVKLIAANTVTVDTVAGNINGAGSFGPFATQFTAVRFVSDRSNYFITGKHL